MTGLPVVSGSQCILALQRLGYTITRIRGSHVRLNCPGRNPVTVPNHTEVDKGTLGNILRTVNINIDEFKNLLKK